MNGDVSKIVHIDIMAFGCQPPKWTKSITTVVHIHYYYIENLARKLQQHLLSQFGRDQHDVLSSFCVSRKKLSYRFGTTREFTCTCSVLKVQIKYDSFMDVTSVFFLS